MSSFISSAQDNLGGSNKAEELDGRSKEENGSLKQREFFWDNIVLFVVSTIIGLAAIDVITEFVRGGGVTCFPPLGVGVDEAQAAYINNFCSGFLPLGAYVPAFMVVHAILITVPHYLWLNHYGGNFDFFFEQASCLKRSRDDKTGEYSVENLIIVQRLESTFTTYRRNSIYHLYILKLVVQFVWSLAGVGFGVGFFLREFSARFMCPPNLNTTTIESWPLNEPVWCVFETLSLLQVLWIADILLLLLASSGLFWAIVWCFSTHATELGSKGVARFAFESGLAPRYYIPTLPISNCFHSCFTSLPYISCSGPSVIKTDLDFLIMRLFLTDSGLGHVFKEVLIEKEVKILLDDDQRRLSFHGTKHKNRKADDSSYIRERDYRDRALDEHDLKWLFPKTKNKVGIYRDFATLPQDQRLTVTSTMRGAVLGLGARAPNNSNAVSISFGDSGYTTALARVFKWVAHLNFSPSYNNPDEVITVSHYYTNVVSLVFAEDILSSPSKDQNKFIEKLRDIWVPPNEEQFLDTCYVVIGPIPREKDFHITSLDVLLEAIAGCLLKDAVLVSIRPLKIEGKRVADDFIRYEPSKYRFSEYPQDSPIVASGRPRLPEWQARKSWQEAMKAQGSSSSSVPSVQATETVHHGQPLLKSEAKDKSPPSSPADVGIVVPGSQSSAVHVQQGMPQTIKQFRHPLEVTCGGSECEVEFSLYYYKDDPHVRRPKMYDPPIMSSAKLDEPSISTLVGKVKNVNIEIDTKPK